MRAALTAVPHALVASCHLSHSYPDGACLYFTFAAAPPAAEIETTYVALWDAGQRAVLAGGGNLSHHHGVGLNRARFMAEALGPALDVLAAVKAALDPQRHPQPGQARPADRRSDRPRGRAVREDSEVCEPRVWVIRVERTHRRLGRAERATT